MRHILTIVFYLMTTFVLVSIAQDQKLIESPLPHGQLKRLDSVELPQNIIPARTFQARSFQPPSLQHPSLQHPSFQAQSIQSSDISESVEVGRKVQQTLPTLPAPPSPLVVLPPLQAPSVLPPRLPASSIVSSEVKQLPNLSTAQLSLPGESLPPQSPLQRKGPLSNIPQIFKALKAAASANRPPIHSYQQPRASEASLASAEQGRMPISDIVRKVKAARRFNQPAIPPPINSVNAEQEPPPQLQQQLKPELEAYPLPHSRMQPESSEPTGQIRQFPRLQSERLPKISDLRLRVQRNSIKIPFAEIMKAVVAGRQTKNREQRPNPSELKKSGLKQGQSKQDFLPISIPKLKSTCANDYTKTTLAIISKTMGLSNKCSLISNLLIASTNKQIHQQASNDRQKLLSITRHLELCTAIDTDLLFLHCVSKTFDNNLHLLDSAAQTAFHFEDLANHKFVSINGAHNTCVNTVLAAAKVKLLETANAYNNCLVKKANSAKYGKTI